jgi:ABC-type transport system involved in cytochrome c biogenesis permease subunit
MSHVLTLVDIRPPVSAFYAVINLASTGILLSIAVGTFWAWQERRAAGLE